MKQEKLVEYCKKASDIANPKKIDYGKGIKAGANQFGYVYGAKGVIYTIDVRNRLLRLGYKPASYFDVQCKKWFDKFVLDCSGLITWALRHETPKLQEQSSGDFYNKCTKKGTIETIPEVAGLCVWKKGHIGVYDGDGFVYESRGAAYGMVKSPLSANSWTHWGYLADVEYSNVPPQKPAIKPTPETKPLFKPEQAPAIELDNGFPIGKGTRGDTVKALQRRLNYRGYDLTVDGIYGDKTELAVKDFQRKNNLAVVGYVGVKTKAKLEATE